MGATVMTPKTVATMKAVHGGGTGLSSSGALVPTAPQSLGSLPGYGDHAVGWTPGFDYMPDVPSPSKPAPLRAHGGASYLDYPPKFSGGMSLSTGLGVLGTLAGVVSVAWPSIMAAMYLAKVGQVYMPSNWAQHCGPNAADWIATPLKWTAFMAQNAAMHAGTTWNIADGHANWRFSAASTTDTVVALSRHHSSYFGFTTWVVSHFNRVFAGPVPYIYDQQTIINLAGAPTYADPILQPIGSLGSVTATAPQVSVDTIGAGGGITGTAVQSILRGRPPKGTREKKGLARSALGRQFWRLGNKLMKVSEMCDAIESLYDALPEDKQIQVSLKRAPNGQVVRPGQPGFSSPGAEWITPGCETQAKQVFKEFGSIDWDEATKNLIQDEIEDRIAGALGKAAQDQANRAGWRRGAGLEWGPAL